MPSPWPNGVSGESVSFVDQLIFEMHKEPFVAGAVLRRVRERLQQGEDPAVFTSWNGRDASEALVRALSDAVLAARQIHVEISDQVVSDLSSAKITSPRLLEVNTPLLFTEGSLRYALSFAMSLHLQLWNQRLEASGVVRAAP